MNIFREYYFFSIKAIYIRHTFDIYMLALWILFSLCAQTLSDSSCPIGKFLSEQECTECVPIFSSTYSTRARTVFDCVECTDSFVTRCAGHACPLGTHKVGTGFNETTLCEKCVPGRYNTNETVGCQECPAGWSSEAEASTECNQCSSVTVASLPGQPCKGCPNGYVRHNATVCAACEPGAFSGPQDTSCRLCPTGTFSNKSAAVRCVLCAPGTISSTEGSVDCSANYSQEDISKNNDYETINGHRYSACSLGSYHVGYVHNSDGRKSICLDCPKGRFGGQGFKRRCKICPAGFYTEGAGVKLHTDCVSCPAGKQSNVNTNACDDCESGTYSSGTGIPCEICPIGQVATMNKQSCGKCAAGKYGEAGICKNCPSGTVSAEGQAFKDACTDCPSGQFSNAGESQCSNCPVGRYEQNSTCEDCSIGFFSNDAGTPECKQCPIGFFSATSLVECTSCGYNRYLKNATHCQRCPDGTYQHTVNGNSENDCQRCPPNTVYKTGVQMTTGVTLTQAQIISKTCLKCPVGKGHTSYGVLDSAKCIECPRGWGSTDTGCKECSPGQYSNVVGFVQVEGGKCNECPLGQYSSEYGSGTRIKSVCRPCSAEHVLYKEQCIGCSNSLYKTREECLYVGCSDRSDKNEAECANTVLCKWAPGDEQYKSDAEFWIRYLDEYEGTDDEERVLAGVDYWEDIRCEPTDEFTYDAFTYRYRQYYFLGGPSINCKAHSLQEMSSRSNVVYSYWQRPTYGTPRIINNTDFYRHRVERLEKILDQYYKDNAREFDPFLTDKAACGNSTSFFGQYASDYRVVDAADTVTQWINRNNTWRGDINTWDDDCPHVFHKCRDCSAGTYGNAQSTSRDTMFRGCAVCPQGKYNSETGTSNCKDCPAGKKSLERGTRYICEDCSSGQFSSGGTAFCSSALECPSGTELHGNVCKSCESGKYRFKEGVEVRAKCADSRFTNEMECTQGQLTVLPAHCSDDSNKNKGECVQTWNGTHCSNPAKTTEGACNPTWTDAECTNRKHSGNQTACEESITSTGYQWSVSPKCVKISDDAAVNIGADECVEQECVDSVTKDVIATSILGSEVECPDGDIIDLVKVQELGSCTDGVSEEATCEKKPSVFTPAHCSDETQTSKENCLAPVGRTWEDAQCSDPSILRLTACTGTPEWQDETQPYSNPSCITCPTGFYSTAYHWSSKEYPARCTECPHGYSSPPNGPRTKCEPCRFNEFSEYTFNTENNGLYVRTKICSVCPAGYESWKRNVHTQDLVVNYKSLGVFKPEFPELFSSDIYRDKYFYRRPPTGGSRNYADYSKPAIIYENDFCVKCLPGLYSQAGGFCRKCSDNSKDDENDGLVVEYRRENHKGIYNDPNPFDCIGFGCSNAAYMTGGDCTQCIRTKDMTSDDCKKCERQCTKCFTPTGQYQNALSTRTSCLRCSDGDALKTETECVKCSDGAAQKTRKQCVGCSDGSDKTATLCVRCSDGTSKTETECVGCSDGFSRNRDECRKDKCSDGSNKTVLQCVSGCSDASKTNPDECLQPVCSDASLTDKTQCLKRTCSNPALPTEYECLKLSCSDGTNKTQEECLAQGTCSDNINTTEYKCVTTGTCGDDTEMPKHQCKFKGCSDDSNKTKAQCLIQNFNVAELTIEGHNVTRIVQPKYYSTQRNGDCGEDTAYRASFITKAECDDLGEYCNHEDLIWSWDNGAKAGVCKHINISATGSRCSDGSYKTNDECLRCSTNSSITNRDACLARGRTWGADEGRTWGADEGRTWAHVWYTDVTQSFLPNEWKRLNTYTRHDWTVSNTWSVENTWTNRTWVQNPTWGADEGRTWGGDTRTWGGAHPDSFEKCSDGTEKYEYQCEIGTCSNPAYTSENACTGCSDGSGDNKTTCLTKHNKRDVYTICNDDDEITQCAVKGYCSDGSTKNKAECNAYDYCADVTNKDKPQYKLKCGYCSDGSDKTRTACEEVGYCSDGSTKNKAECTKPIQHTPTNVCSDGTLKTQVECEGCSDRSTKSRFACLYGCSDGSYKTKNQCVGCSDGTDKDETRCIRCSDGTNKTRTACLGCSDGSTKNKAQCQQATGPHCSDGSEKTEVQCKGCYKPLASGFDCDKTDSPKGCCNDIDGSWGPDKGREWIETDRTWGEDENRTWGRDTFLTWGDDYGLTWGEDENRAWHGDSNYTCSDGTDKNKNQCLYCSDGSNKTSEECLKCSDTLFKSEASCIRCSDGSGDKTEHECVLCSDGVSTQKVACGRIRSNGGYCTPVITKFKDCVRRWQIWDPSEILGFNKCNETMQSRGYFKDETSCVSCSDGSNKTKYECLNTLVCVIKKRCREIQNKCPEGANFCEDFAIQENRGQYKDVCAFPQIRYSVCGKFDSAYELVNPGFEWGTDQGRKWVTAPLTWGPDENRTWGADEERTWGPDENRTWGGDDTPTRRWSSTPTFTRKFYSTITEPQWEKLNTWIEPTSSTNISWQHTTYIKTSYDPNEVWRGDTNTWTGRGTRRWIANESSETQRFWGADANRTWGSDNIWRGDFAYWNVPTQGNTWLPDLITEDPLKKCPKGTERKGGENADTEWKRCQDACTHGEAYKLTSKLSKTHMTEICEQNIVGLKHRNNVTCGGCSDGSDKNKKQCLWVGCSDGTDKTETECTGCSNNNPGITRDYKCEDISNSVWRRDRPYCSDGSDKDAIACALACILSDGRTEFGKTDKRPMWVNSGRTWMTGSHGYVYRPVENEWNGASIWYEDEQFCTGGTGIDLLDSLPSWHWSDYVEWAYFTRYFSLFTGKYDEDGNQIRNEYTEEARYSNPNSKCDTDIDDFVKFLNSELNGYEFEFSTLRDEYLLFKTDEAAANLTENNFERIVNVYDANVCNRCTYYPSDCDTQEWKDTDYNGDEITKEGKTCVPNGRFACEPAHKNRYVPRCSDGSEKTQEECFGCSDSRFTTEASCTRCSDGSNKTEAECVLCSDLGPRWKSMKISYNRVQCLGCSIDASANGWYESKQECEAYGGTWGPAEGRTWNGDVRSWGGYKYDHEFQHDPKTAKRTWGSTKARARTWDEVEFESKPCPRGKWTWDIHGNHASCEGCPVGRYGKIEEELDGAVFKESSTCLGCMPGKYQDEEGKTSCKTPAAGYIVSSENAAIATKCYTGGEYMYANADKTECIGPWVCPAGTAREGWHRSMPKTDLNYARAACIQGGKTGELEWEPFQFGECESTAANSFDLVAPFDDFDPRNGLDTLNCCQCEPGKYSPGGPHADTSCKLCPNGFYSTHHDTSQCKECPAGRVAAPYWQMSYYRNGRVSLRGCPQTNGAATYYNYDTTWNDDGPCTSEARDGAGNLYLPWNSNCDYRRGYYESSPCTLCPVGKYGHKKECHECPENTYQDELGATACKACPNGYIMSEGSCQGCPAGTYSRQSQVTKRMFNRAWKDLDDAALASIQDDDFFVYEMRRCGSCSREYYDNVGCASGVRLETATLLNRNDNGKLVRIEPGTRYGNVNCEGVREWTNTISALTCKDCPFGYYQENANSGSCTKCPMGKIGRSSNEKISEDRGCDTCPGSQQSNRDRTNCLPDNDDEIIAQIQYTSCPAGKHGAYVESKSDPCTLCSYGHAGKSCSLCTVGKYADQRGLADCKDCLVGEYVPFAGWASTCIGCPRGYDTVNTASSKCTLCPYGRYKEERSAGLCKSCGQGVGTDIEGAISSTQCSECAQGKYIADGTGHYRRCQKCRRGYFGTDCAKTCAAGKESTGIGAVDGQCDNCTVGKYSTLKGGTCVLCPIGKYQDETGQGECKDCTTATLTPSLGATSSVNCTVNGCRPGFVQNYYPPGCSDGTNKSETDCRRTIVDNTPLKFRPAEYCSNAIFKNKSACILGCSDGSNKTEAACIRCSDGTEKKQAICLVGCSDGSDKDQDSCENTCSEGNYASETTCEAQGCVGNPRFLEEKYCTKECQTTGTNEILTEYTEPVRCNNCSQKTTKYTWDITIVQEFVRIRDKTVSRVEYMSENGVDFRYLQWDRNYTKLDTFEKCQQCTNTDINQDFQYNHTLLEKECKRMNSKYYSSPVTPINMVANTVKRMKQLNRYNEPERPSDYNKKFTDHRCRVFVYAKPEDRDNDNKTYIACSQSTDSRCGGQKRPDVDGFLWRTSTRVGWDINNEQKSYETYYLQTIHTGFYLECDWGPFPEYVDGNRPDCGLTLPEYNFYKGLSQWKEEPPIDRRCRVDYSVGVQSPIEEWGADSNRTWGAQNNRNWTLSNRTWGNLRNWTTSGRTWGPQNRTWGADKGRTWGPDSGRTWHDNTICEMCATGKFYVDATTCQDCLRGEYQNLEGQFACHKCPIGTFSNEKAVSDCTWCGAFNGKEYQNEQGQTTCKSCREGYHVTDATKWSVVLYRTLLPTSHDVLCTKCPPGKTSSMDDYSCIDCPDHHYSNEDTEGCQDCPNPVQSIRSWTHNKNKTGCVVQYKHNETCPAFAPNCILCGSGMVHDGQACVKCGPGKYSDNMLDTECKSCEAGKFQPTGGQEECLPCFAGQEQALEGQTACQNCPQHHYQDAEGQAVCKECPTGWQRSSLHARTECTLCGSTLLYDNYTQDAYACQRPSATECADDEQNAFPPEQSCRICPSGTFVNGNICEICPSGWANEQPKSTTCDECQPGTYATTSGCQKCVPGRYQDEAARTDCIDCAAGRFRTSESADKLSDCEKCAGGQYTPTDASAECIECAHGREASYDRNICVNCAAGRWSERKGTQCTKCAHGTYGNEFGATRFICKSCPENMVAAADGLAACGLCPAGKYKLNKYTCTACPSGWSSIPERTKCVKCSAGSSGKPDNLYTSLNANMQVFCRNELGSSSDNVTCLSDAVVNISGVVGKRSELCGLNKQTGWCITCTSTDGKYGPCDEHGVRIGDASQTDDRSQSDDRTWQQCTQSYEPSIWIPSHHSSKEGYCADGSMRSTQTLCENRLGASEWSDSQDYYKCIPYTGLGDAPVDIYDLYDDYIESGEDAECEVCPAGRTSHHGEKDVYGATCVKCPSNSIQVPFDPYLDERIGKYFGYRVRKTPHYLWTCDDYSHRQENTCEENYNASVWIPGFCSDGSGRTAEKCDRNFTASNWGHYYSYGTRCLDFSTRNEEYCYQEVFESTYVKAHCADGSPRWEWECTKEYTAAQWVHQKQRVDGQREGVPYTHTDFDEDPGPYWTKPEDATDGTIPEEHYYMWTGNVLCTGCPIGSYGTLEQSDAENATYINNLVGLHREPWEPYPDNPICTQCQWGQVAGDAGEKTKSDGKSLTDLSSAGFSLQELQIEQGFPSTTCKECSQVSIMNLWCTTCFEEVNLVPKFGESGCQCKETFFGTAETGCVQCQQGQEYKNGICQSCPKGTYCTGNTGQKQECPKGTYGDQTGLGQVTQCKDCANGKYGDQTKQTSDTCKDCPKGYYGDQKKQTSCKDCAKGQYGDADKQTSCKDCAKGQYSDAVKQTSCKDCAKGQYSDAVKQTSCKDCPQGQYSDAVKQTSCKDCAKGQYSDADKQTSCKDCAKGQYSDAVKQTSCKDCPQGFKSTSAFKNCTKCTKGKYATTGVDTCTDCEAGTYSSQEASSSCTNCTAGTYSPKAGSTACSDCEKGKHQPNAAQSSCKNCAKGEYADAEKLSACKSCPKGYKSTSTFTNCTQCDDGQYAPAGSDDCKKCDAGLIPSSDSSSCTNCTAGKYSPEAGSAKCSDCEKGKHQPSDGQTSCEDCDTGEFTNAVQQSACKTCPKGFVSTQTFENCTKCDVGTYSANASDTCTQCENGKYQGQAGEDACIVCPAGYQSTETFGNCTKCTAGKFSLKESEECIKCAVGTISDSEGATSCTNCTSGKFAAVEGSSNCTDCPAGKYTTVHHSYYLDECDTCSAGTYSIPGQATCSNCTAGKFSDDAAGECDNCTAGKFSEEASTECTDCTAGTYSEGTAGTCTACPAGTYSEEDKASECSNCTAGTYSTTQSSECLDCTAGTYSGDIASECSNCTAGTYSDDKATECSNCTAGTYSSDIASECLDCTAGTYSGDIASECLNCTAGTYSEEDKATECSNCTAGTYSIVQSSECSDCTAGTYSSATAQKCLHCTAGTYSLEKAAKCLNCTAGTYSQEKAPKCSNCTAGTYSSDVASTCLNCTAGTYSGDRASVCLKCTAGTYSGVVAPKCLNCIAGTYSDVQAAECSNCTAGTYSGDAATQCSNCTGGTYSDDAAAQCSNCTAGTYSEEKAVECLKCTAGTYSGDIASECLNCTTGTYSQEKAPKCSNCTAGTYSGDIASECSNCTAGTYSGDVADTCMNCTAGTYSGDIAPKCLNCTAGTYSGDIAPKCLNCTAGTYSGDVAPECLNCTAGTYSGDIASGCLNCTAGTYSGDVAGTCMNCTAGTYSGDIASECSNCTAGTYSGDIASECSNCTTGTYSGDIASECLNCTAGTYSEEKAPKCSNCTAGTYSGDIASECLNCTTGTFSRSDASTRCSYCGLDTYQNQQGQTSCIACPIGTVSSFGSDQCHSCGNGSVAANTLPSNKFGCVNYTNMDSIELKQVYNTLECVVNVTDECDMLRDNFVPEKACPLFKTVQSCANASNLCYYRINNY